MTLDRRSLLGLIGAGAATPAVAKSANTGKVAFLHGVASGDPGSHSAVFWTRVTPEAGAGAMARSRGRWRAMTPSAMSYAACPI